MSSLYSVLFGAGLFFVAWQAAAQDSGSPVPGAMIDIGGWQLHVNCRGTGSPTVVLESGAGDFSVIWGLVQPEVSRVTRVCSYDRAGLAWSDRGPLPRTMRQVAFEIHTALARRGEKPPYVLVGHSLGGLFVRVFNREYAPEVAGFVFVDAVTEGTIIGPPERLRPLREYSRGRTVPGITKTFARPVGLDSFIVPADMVLPSNAFAISKLGPDQQRAYIAARRLGTWEETGRSEQDFWGEEALELFERRAAAPRELGDKPSIVLTRDPKSFPAAEAQATEIRHREHVALSELSTHGELRMIENTSHAIQLEQPGAVIEAVRQVITVVRNGKSAVRD